MEYSESKKNEVVQSNSWDLVAYVLSLTKDPKPTAPPPSNEPAANDGATDSGSDTGDNADDGYGDEYGY